MIKLQGLTLGQRMGKAILVLLGAPTGLQDQVGKPKGKQATKKGATGSTDPRKPR